MKKDVMLWTGAGQIGMAIARRMGSGMKIVVGDKKLENAQKIAEIMNSAGFDAEPTEMDISDRSSIKALIEKGLGYGNIKMLVNAAGVSPSQESIETILKVDLYGTAVLLEEVGKVISEGGVGVTISSQSGKRMPQLTAEEDALLACTETEKLLELDILKPENIRDTLHAYQMAKRCNEKRVMAESVKWGERKARINSISPGIIVTPLAIDEFNGPRGDFYKNMFAQCPAGRPGTADEVANAAELLMSEKVHLSQEVTYYAMAEQQQAIITVRLNHKYNEKAVLRLYFADTIPLLQYFYRKHLTEFYFECIIFIA